MSEPTEIAQLELEILARRDDLRAASDVVSNKVRQIRELRLKLADLKFGLRPGRVIVITKNKRERTGAGVRYLQYTTEARISKVGEDCGMSLTGKGTLWVNARLKDGSWSGHETKLYSWDAWELKKDETA